jgi:hypothetical protein
MAADFKYVLPRKVSVVYQITFPGCTSKRYIGSGKAGPVGCDVEHIRTLRRGKHDSLLLQRDYDRYGESAIRFEVLECPRQAKHLASREQYYIDRCPSMDRYDH